MKQDSNSFIANGALISLMGFILSGPVSVLVVMWIAPQPLWISAEEFVSHYHPIQSLPYYFGFMLLLGLMLLVTGHVISANDAPPQMRLSLWLSFALAIVFVSLVAFNYICQTLFIPHLVSTYTPQHDPLIAAFSMSNPYSLSWGMEMWGYAILGLSNWYMASYYQRRKPFISILLRMNLVLSLMSLAWTILQPNWVDTTIGLLLFMAWNILMILIMILLYWDARNITFGSPGLQGD